MGCPGFGDGVASHADRDTVIFRYDVSVSRILVQMVGLEVIWKITSRLKLPIWPGKYGGDVFGVTTVEGRRWERGEKQPEAGRSEQACFEKLPGGRIFQRGTAIVPNADWPVERRAAVVPHAGYWPIERLTGIVTNTKCGLGQAVPIRL